MKKTIIIGLVFCAAGGLNATLTTPSDPYQITVSKSKTAQHQYKEITTQELQEMLKNKQSPLVILDARSSEYDDGQRIPGAILMPSDSTPKQLAAVIPSKDTPVVVYCSNLRCPASKYLAESLVQLGYTNVMKYPEGINGWVQAGNQVIKNNKT